MRAPLDHADLLRRWDDLTKAELWTIDTGDLHNIIDVAVEELERLNGVVTALDRETEVHISALVDTEAELRRARGRLQAILDLDSGHYKKWSSQYGQGLNDGWRDALSEMRSLVLGEPEPPEAQK